MYNSSLCFASCGADINGDKILKANIKNNHANKNIVDINERNRGVYSFRIQGIVYHSLGPLIPKNQENPNFAQIYFYDTDNEIQNRMKVANKLNEKTLTSLQKLIHDINTFYQKFKNTLDNHVNTNNHIQMIIRADKGYYI